jgi:hypothetical protein
MASQIIISAELFSIPTLFPRDWRLTLRYVGLLQLRAAAAPLPLLSAAHYLVYVLPFVVRSSS